MPVGVVTNEEEEHKWERAKQIAAEEGHEKDWQYIMGIYKRMNPKRFKVAAALLKSALYKEAYSSTTTPSYGSPSSGEFKYRGGINPGVGTAVGPRPPVRPTFQPRPVTGFRTVSQPPSSKPVSAAPSSKAVPYGYSRNSSGDLVSRPAIGLATAYDDPVGANNIVYSRNAKAYGAPTPVPRSVVRKPVAKPAPRPKPVARSIAPSTPASTPVPPRAQTVRMAARPAASQQPAASRTSSNWTYVPPALKYDTFRKVNKAQDIDPYMKWDAATNRYTMVPGVEDHGEYLQAHNDEYHRLTNKYNSMTPAQQAKYKDVYNKHLQGLVRTPEEIKQQFGPAFHGRLKFDPKTNSFDLSRYKTKEDAFRARRDEYNRLSQIWDRLTPQEQERYRGAMERRTKALGLGSYFLTGEF